jgi:hypothetical protein
MNKRHHIGIIVSSPSFSRVNELLDGYIDKVRHDFYTSAPPKESPTD